MNFSENLITQSSKPNHRHIFIAFSDHMGDLFQIPELWLFMSVLVYVMGMGVVSRPRSLGKDLRKVFHILLTPKI